MQTLHYYQARNEQGQDLLDHYISILCTRLGLRLEVRNAHKATNRGDMLKSHLQANIVVFDLSIEPGHCYGTLTETVKNSKKVILISRTPLPRNVFVPGQMCAPIHGHSLTNDEISHWLEGILTSIIRKADGGTLPVQNLFQPKWISTTPGNMFLSFRGTKEAEATRWARQYEGSTREIVRMVATGEYAYPTECMSAQQLWEGVWRLGREMNRCPKVMIHYSDDYFDSFWTSSELLWLLRFRQQGQNIRNVKINTGNQIDDLVIGPKGLNVPPLVADESRWLKQVLNNSDPYTAAPETQIPAQGAAKVLKAVLKPLMGYYKEEFTSPAWWSVIRVPCPYCRPSRRAPEQVEWMRHIQNHLTPFDSVDYFGYFPVQEADLVKGHVQCPQCRNTLQVANQKPPRYLWMPIQTTERDQEREMFVENRVWEVRDNNDQKIHF